MTCEVLWFCQPSRSYLRVPGVVLLSAKLLPVAGPLGTPQAPVVEKGRSKAMLEDCLFYHNWLLLLLLLIPNTEGKRRKSIRNVKKKLL